MPKKRKEKVKNPFKDLELDAEEQIIENDLVKGKYKRTARVDDVQSFFERAAENFSALNQSKRITIRINQKDLLKIRAKANKSGIPYQTLLNMLIHNFAEGQTKIQI